MNRIFTASEPGIMEKIMRSPTEELIKQGRKWDAYDGLITAMGAEFYGRKPCKIDHSFFTSSLNAHSSFFCKAH